MEPCQCQLKTFHFETIITIQPITHNLCFEGYYPSYDADVEFFLQADIYSYGMVLAFCLTSESPWSTVETAILKDEEDWDASVAKVALPEKLAKDDPIRAIIECCYAEDRSVRPRTAKSVIEKYFKGNSYFNPILVRMLIE